MHALCYQNHLQTRTTLALAQLRDSKYRPLRLIEVFLLLVSSFPQCNKLAATFSRRQHRPSLRHHRRHRLSCTSSKHLATWYSRPVSHPTLHPLCLSRSSRTLALHRVAMRYSRANSRVHRSLRFPGLEKAHHFSIPRSTSLATIPLPAWCRC